MKIEKISSNQIKCFLNKGDLLSRQIKVSELAYGTEKAQELFKDMMDQASSEFGFEVENMPLMIEAVPLSTDSIMLIITKVDNPEDLEDKFIGLQPSDSRKFKKKETLDKDDMAYTTSENDDAQTTVHTFLVYKFSTFDHVTKVAQKLATYDFENTTLYKDNEKNYYLSIISSSIDRITFKMIRGMLSEYAVQVQNKKTILSYYDEHYTTIIKDKAVKVLISL